MFDVIVMGARCAGSSLAMLLARKGYRVLAVDKARFPSDTVSTHVMWHADTARVRSAALSTRVMCQAGLARTKRWGLLDRIMDLGAPPIRSVSFSAGDV